jgi:hypothetical protein
MRCTACGFENVTDASFCGECGASLMAPFSTVNEKPVSDPKFELVGSVAL